MRSFRLDPYLWVHLTGIAAVPIFLELCVVGLAIGEPLFPLWFELLFVGSIGILPILWMQWQRPFSIFSLLALAVKPAQLTDDQRRILSLFKTPISHILTLLTAIFMGWVLWQLYAIAPSIAPTIDWLPTARGAGLVIAAVAFLGSNLFIQVPVSVLRVLLSSANQFAAIEPYPANQVAKGFTVAGIRVAKILPPLVSETPATASSQSSGQAKEPIAPKVATQSATLAVPENVEPDILEEEWEEEEPGAIAEVALAASETEFNPQTIAQDQIREDADIELTESESIPDSLFAEADTAEGDEIFDAVAMADAGVNLSPVEDEPPVEDELVAEIVDEIVGELADGTVVETIAIEVEIVSGQPPDVLEEIVDLTEEILIPEEFAVERGVIEAEQIGQAEAVDDAPTEIAASVDYQMAEQSTEANVTPIQASDSTDADHPQITIVEDETVAESYPVDNTGDE